MKAAVLRGPRDIRIEQVETPPIRDDEVLVKVMACGICGTDIHAYKKGCGAKPRERLILGHEFSGEIAKVGQATQGLRIGDRVVGEQATATAEAAIDANRAKLSGVRNRWCRARGWTVPSPSMSSCPGQRRGRRFSRFLKGWGGRRRPPSSPLLWPATLSPARASRRRKRR